MPDLAGVSIKSRRLLFAFGLSVILKHLLLEKYCIGFLFGLFARKVDGGVSDSAGQQILVLLTVGGFAGGIV